MTDQFLDVFREYNLGVFPMQNVFYLLGMATIYLAVNPTNLSGKLISGVLDFFWLWMGLVYHVLYFTDPNSPTFWLPCPTTIFTFGLLLLTIKRFPPGLLIIPFVWSIIGFTAAFQFGMVEDTGLLVAGLITVSLLLIRNKLLSGKNNPAKTTNAILLEKL